MFLSLQTFLDKIGNKILQFLFGWFIALSPMMKVLLVLGLLFLAVIGTISLIKWSVKVLFPLAVVGIFIILLYVFVLK